MRAAKVNVSRFGGIQTSVDKVGTPPNVATEGKNYLCLDGSLKPRYGFRKLADPPANFDGMKGFTFVSGYDTSNVEQEEYLCFEKRTGVATLKPYRLETATWTRTEITNAGAALTLTNSEWYAICCKGIAYCFNDTDGIYKHTVGTTNTFQPLVMPVAPTAKPTWGAVNAVGITMVGIDPTNAAEVAVTGLASNTNSSFSDPLVNIRHSTGIGAATVTFILAGTTAGKFDWYYNDAFSFTMVPRYSTALDFDPNSIAVTLENDAGTPITIEGTVYTKRNAGSTMTQVLVWWDKNKVRADWGDGSGTGKTAKIKISYNVSKNSTSGTGTASSEIEFWFGIGASRVGWKRTLPLGSTTQVLQIAYSYYNSTADLESDLSPISDIPYRDLLLPDPDNVEFNEVGAKMNLGFPASSDAAVDKVRIYVKDVNNKWRRVDTVNDTSSPYPYFIAYADILNLLYTYDARAFETTRKIVCATEFRGSVVWGYKGGYQNIKYSRTDGAEGQASPYDELDDDARGATYHLSENFDDEPLSLFGIGDCLLALGQKGAYWQTGDKPSNMSPMARIPGSRGAAGRRAAAKWPHGVAYLTSSGDIRSVSGGIGGFTDEEVSVSLRGFVKLYLGNETGVALSMVNAFYDERTDALWFTNGTRAVVLRRENVADQKRHWHPQEYFSTILYGTANAEKGIVCMRSSGQVDEFDWNSTTGAYIEGVNRDAGSPMPVGNWVGGSIRTSEGRTRLGSLEADYDGIAVFHVHSDRQVSGPLVLDSGRRHTRCDAFQQGWNHYVEVAVDENLGELRGFNIEVVPMSAGVNR
jgi:hypothetical protein